MRMINKKESIEEKVASPESGGGLDAGKLDAIDAGAEKVSEIVGESASENKAVAVKKKGQQSKKDEALTKISPEAQKVVLPSISVQKKRIRQVLKKEHRHLLREAQKMQKSKNFSAHKLELIVLRIRKIQMLLAELVVAAKDRIQSMYEQYVMSGKNKKGESSVTEI